MKIRSRLLRQQQALSVTVALPDGFSDVSFRTDRGAGRRDGYTLRLPIAGDGSDNGTVTATMRVAGETITDTQPSASDGFVTLSWDGGSSRAPHVAEVRMEWVVDGTVMMVKDRRYLLGSTQPTGVGLGGWMLSQHHVMVGRRLYRSDRTIALPDLDLDGSAFSGSIDPPDRGVRYRFDNHRHTETIDRFLGTTLASFSYDDDGRLNAIASDSRPSLAIRHDGTRSELLSDAGGPVVVERRDDRAMLAVAGDELVLEIDDDCLVTSSSLNGDLLARYRYDDVGRIVRIERTGLGPLDVVRTEHSDGFEVRTVSGEGRETGVRVRRNGDETATEHWCCGTDYRQVRAKSSEGSSTQFGDGSVVTRSEHTDGSVQTERQTGDGTPLHTTRRTREDGDDGSFKQWVQTDRGESTVEFDAPSRAWQMVSPEGRRTSVVLDEHLRPIASRRGDRAAVTKIYDGDEVRTETEGFAFSEKRINGLPAELAADDTAMCRFRHDDAGRLVAQEGPDSRQVELAYDSADRITRVAATPDLALDISYLPWSGVASIGLDDGSQIGYEYDGDGLLVGVSNPDGSRRVFGRDVAGRVTGITDANGKECSFVYDRAGRLVRAESGESTVERVYEGLTVRTTEAVGAASAATSVTFGEHAQPETLTFNDRDVPLRYDKDGLLVAVGPLTIQRDSVGSIVTRTAGVVTESIGRDALGQMVDHRVEVGGEELWSVRYEYASVGRVAAVAETLDGTTTDKTFSYDLLGRLIASETGGVATNYAYDAAGALNGVDRGIEQGAGGHLLHAATSEGEMQFALDGAARLGSIASEKGTTSYVHGPLGQLAAIRSETGQTSFHRDAWGRVAVVTQADGAEWHVIYDEAKTPVLLFRGENAYRVIADRTGSVRLVIDIELGELLETRDYDPWGVRAERADVLARQPFGFGGGIDDPQGITTFGVRQYVPVLGRFVTRDPLLAWGRSTNMFLFADGDPINRADPSGSEVLVCERLSGIPWQGNLGFNHKWIKTESGEVGMGLHPQPDPDDLVVTQTVAERDHSGRHQMDGTKCYPIPDIDEACVDEAMQLDNVSDGGIAYGDDLGQYLPGNTCHDWVEETIGRCSGISILPLAGDGGVGKVLIEFTAGPAKEFPDPVDDYDGIIYPPMP